MAVTALLSLLLCVPTHVRPDGIDDSRQRLPVGIAGSDYRSTVTVVDGYRPYVDGYRG